ncbi:MAG: dipeptidase PepV [Clostridia bacterium]
MNFDKAIEAKLDEVVQSISRICKINSVEDAPKKGMPFGEGPAKALECALEIGEELGFTTENFENYVGHINFGTEKQGIVGVLAHVDVVPAGEGWEHNPWGGEVSDGIIWGRGTMDDKGPIITCVYAMKILEESGLPLSKQIRVILGTNEETNWGCMDYYTKVVQPIMPDVAFSPDASFPVTYAEKGILQYKLETSFDGDAKIYGGNAFNAVPSIAFAEIYDINQQDITQAVEKIDTQCIFEIEKIENGVKIVSNGKGAHAARLESGVNAISGLMLLLGELDLQGDLKKVIDFYNTHMGTTYYGEKMGIYKVDESGNLTFNVGKIEIADGKCVICCDNRIPVTADINETIDIIKAKIEVSEFEYVELCADAPLYIAKDSPLVTTLMEAYKDVTGDKDAVAITAGGGTYSRTVDNCVAFGCRLPYQANTIHQANEHLKIEDVKMWLKIYTEALYRLAK